MPKIATVEASELLPFLLEAKDQLFDQNGNIRGPHQPVWVEISNKLKGKIKPNYIYQRVKQNRGNLLDYLKDDHSPEFQGDTYKKEPEAASETEASEHSEEDAVVKPHKTFIVTVPALEWKKMEPVATEYKRSARGKPRNIYVLPPYLWEDILIRLLREQHKIPCPYSFDRGRVSVDEFSRDQYIKVDAHCADCGAVAVGRILHEPVHGEGVTMEWRCADTRGIPHKKKRYLTRDVRNEVSKNIVNSSPLLYRRLQANMLMDNGDIESPQLYTLDVLRKAKQQFKDLNADVIHGPDPIMCLELMKHEQPYCGSIHDIGQDKFYIHYYTPTQLHIYKMFCKSEYVVLVLDATGTLATKILRLHGPSEHIFLYQGVMHTTSLNLPVVQMLSEKQDANSILYWLNEWERAGASCPNEAVTDNSAALKSALARSFGRCSDIKEYKEKCFMVLNGKSKNLPPCFIRLDVAHYIKAAKNWNSFKDKSVSRLRDFFLRCLGLLIKAKTMKEYEEIIIHILTLALSEAEGKDEYGNEVPMEDSLRFLINKIKGGSMLDEENECEVTTSEQFLPDRAVSDSPSCIRDWINALEKRVITKICNESRKLLRVNPYFSKEIAEEFIRITHDFTLWSAVMVIHFNSPHLTASSAHVEGEFEVLKHKILLGEKKPMQPHKLVGKHLQSIFGCMKIAASIKSSSNNAKQVSLKSKVAESVEISPFKKHHDNDDDEHPNISLPMETEAIFQNSACLSKDNLQEEEDGTSEPTVANRNPGITSDEESAPNDLNFYENWRNKMGQKRKSDINEFVDMSPCTKENKRKQIFENSAWLSKDNLQEEKDEQSKPTVADRNSGTSSDEDFFDLKYYVGCKNEMLPKSKSDINESVDISPIKKERKKKHSFENSACLSKDSLQEEAEETSEPTVADGNLGATSAKESAPIDLNSIESWKKEMGQKRKSDINEFVDIITPRKKENKKQQSLENSACNYRHNYLPEEENELTGAKSKPLMISHESADELHSYGNWRNNIGQKRSKDRKSKYMTACPELDAALHVQRLKRPQKNLLINGNKTGFIKTNSNTYVTTSNTCAFDALATVIANGYIEIESYRSFLDQSSNYLLQTALNLATVGAVPATYLLRTEALASIRSPNTLPSVPGKNTSTVSLHYDGWCNATNMAKELLKSIYSMQVNIQCTNKTCKRSKQKSYEVIDTNIKTILCEGFACLADAIAISLTHTPSESSNEVLKTYEISKCINECKGSPTFMVSGQNHLIIDVDYLGSQHPSYTHLKHNKPYKLGDLPLTLTVAGKKYVLLGVVAYRPGHYTAYTKKIASQTWDHHDGLSRKVTTNVALSIEILPHILYYVMKS